MSRRIALGSLFIECNHLGGVPTDIGFFERGEFRSGEMLLEMADGTLGGMVGLLRSRSVDIAPLIAAVSCPSGPLTRECYQRLRTEMLRPLARQVPVDGVLLALHGAASAEDVGDVEGDLLQAVRELVGETVPIVATLDLHAHVTEQMVRAADALLAWETYPHRDAFETGDRGARMLLGILDGIHRPTMALSKAPVLVGGVQSGTEGDAPFAEVMRLAKSFESRPGVLSTSAFLVHPYLDLPGMGGGGLVITDDDIGTASTLAREIAQYYWQRRFDLEPEIFAPEDAIRRALEIDGGPVLLAESSDTCGGGAAGDNVAALKALLRHARDVPGLAPVVDPSAAAVCHEAGIGSVIEVPLGHSLDPRWGEPVDVRGEVRALGDGDFIYTGGIYEGQVGRMGASAVLRCGAVEILVTTHATYDWADEQFRCMGLEPAAAKLVVVKNPMNFRVGYAGIYAECFVLDTPGSTPPTLRHVEFENVERPYFPRDEEIPGFVPRVITGGS